jgi:uncharacterized protein (DUF433 family)
MAENGSGNQATIVYVPASERNSPTPATWIEKAPGVCGGDARVRRLRIPVWSLVEARQGGLSDSRLLECFPLLTAADLAAAWEYYELNKEEIDQAILLQEEAMRLGPDLFEAES